jgi:hypothetical protein
MYSDVNALFVYCHWECVVHECGYFTIWICFVLGRYCVVYECTLVPAPSPRVICCVVQRSLPERCHYWRMLWVIYLSKVDFIRVVAECHVVVIHIVYVEHICTQPQSLEVSFNSVFGLLYKCRTRLMYKLVTTRHCYKYTGAQFIQGHCAAWLTYHNTACRKHQCGCQTCM